MKISVQLFPLLVVAVSVNAQISLSRVTNCGYAPFGATANNKLVFSGKDCGGLHSGVEPYYTDGGSTAIAADIHPGIMTGTIGYSSQPRGFYAHQDKVFFVAATNALGEELYCFTGDTAVLMKDIFPGGYSAFNTSGMFGFHSIGNRIYFFAADNNSGMDLWSSDGTPAGTVKVADLNYAASEIGNHKGRQVVFNGSLYFVWKDDIKKFDPATQQLSTIADLSGGLDYGPAKLTVFNNHLAFVYNAPGFGTELYFTDGTSSPVVVDVVPGSTGSAPSHLFSFNNMLLFTAYVGTSYHLYKAEYHPATNTFTATHLKQFATAVPAEDGGSTQGFGFVQAGSLAYFMMPVNPVASAKFDNLWQTNGTDTGTKVSFPITAAQASIGLIADQSKWLTWHNGLFYFQNYRDLFAIDLASNNIYNLTDTIGQVNFQLKGVINGKLVVVVTNMNNYLPDWYSINDNTILPFDDVHLHAKEAGNKVALNWTTEFDGFTAFEIEHSYNGNQFSKVAETPASPTEKNYGFTHYFNAAQVNIYRVKAKKKEGNSVFSNMVKLDRRIAQPFRIYPNPARSVLHVESGTMSRANYAVYDLTGRRMMSGQLHSAGNTLPIEHLPTGSYLLVVFADGHKTENYPFLKTN